ncbi:Transcription regulator of the Arc/MetJ class [Geodermatophilus saharensis]|uniref:Transcription regulator of the Arc/MetJ class n=1 Tax=Geodermatophilus saharensis TaxID=1137994 RepID=A0A239BDH4_9ACTN|nr:type II toxin-antitoxin system VapB family antitoxin [Geodermatophilus saharensis]SNS05779.1 Transcription regulator of the Arc/MetJ class [Geodermatophilus saharensis]
MGRTTIDIDDDLVGRVMRRYGLRTKKDAVDFALRQVSAAPMTPREMHAMQGSGWDGDLDGTRRGEAEELAGQWPVGPAAHG